MIQLPFMLSYIYTYIHTCTYISTRVTKKLNLLQYCYQTIEFIQICHFLINFWLSGPGSNLAFHIAFNCHFLSLPQPMTVSQSFYFTALTFLKRIGHLCIEISSFGFFWCLVKVGLRLFIIRRDIIEVICSN